jgi:methionyl-tRNA formyltransferase
MIVTVRNNEISELAVSHNVPTVVYESESHLVAALTQVQIDFGFVIWWPHILHMPLINIPKNGFINTHPSLLPYARGKHCNFWTIVEQAPFGVTLHKVTPGIDDGEICFQKEIPYSWTDNGETLYKMAQAEMVTLFCESYPKIRTGNLELIPQDLNKGSFHRASEIHNASKIDLDSLISARKLLNLLRARTFEGYPGCWFEDNGEIFEARIQITKKSE